MSVIIRLQNLPWSANALDIRNYFRGLSIPEGGVHIVGGELGDAFIAFSTDEDARQAMMLDGGKIKEIQVKLLLSSRSEMHKVIEAARQSVPILTLTAPAPPAPISVPVAAPAPAPAVIPAPTPASVIPQPAPTPAVIAPFSAALGNSLSSFGIPGIGNPQEIPQPAVIEPPAPLISPPVITTDDTIEKEDEKSELRRRSKERERRRSRSSSRSRDRDRRERKRDRRDRSRSRERRRRDRSRSKERRDRKRDRNQRSRSRERSPSRKSRDRRTIDRKSPQNEKSFEQSDEQISAPPPPNFGNKMPLILQPPNMMPNGPPMVHVMPNTFNDPTISDAYNKLQELGKKRNPNAFQGDQQNGGRMQSGRGGGNMARGGANFRMGGRPSRFDNENRDCCVAVRNAPNHTSYGDVRRFFPFMIDKHGIKMINDNLGRRTGNIFVRFCDPRSKHLALQRKNNELKGAQVIVEALDDDAYESAVDSFLPYREDNDEEEPILTIPEPEENTSSFSILKLSDLPNFVKEHDIIKAFSDFSLLSMMLNDDRQTRTRIAFVQFAKAEDAKAAYERKDKYLFGRRQATITPCTEEDYEKEKILQNEKLTGDPRTVPRNEIRKEVIEEPQEMEPIVPRDPRQRRPQFENGPGQQPATVQAIPPGTNFFGTFAQGGQQFPTPFPNPQFAGFPGGMDPRTAAANWANRPNFPNQMISNQLVSNQIVSNQMGPNQMGPNQIVQSINQPINDLDDEPLDCVLMKGLPREATDRTIVTFLSDTGAVPARIHLMLDQSGMPSGDCFCEFRSVQEARLATTKHGHNLEGCRVTVDLVNRSVVEEALEGPKQPEIQDAILGAPPGPPQQFFENSRGGFPGRGFRGRGSFDRGGFDRGGFDRGFNPSRGGYDHNRGNSYRGRGFGDRGGGDRGGRGIDRGRGRGFGRGRGGYENGAPREEPDSTLEDFGAPGCVVSMENVPFRATVEEILSFFGDFDLTQDDVIRRYNERGQPTGDARVAFRTPYDAQRACKTRHMDTIHDRRINLSIL